MVMQGEKDDKIIAVCADDPEYRHFKDIKELPPHRLAEIRRFFEDCEAHLNSDLWMKILILIFEYYTWYVDFQMFVHNWRRFS